MTTAALAPETRSPLLLPRLQGEQLELLDENTCASSTGSTNDNENAHKRAVILQAEAHLLDKPEGTLPDTTSSDRHLNEARQRLLSSPPSSST